MDSALPVHEVLAKKLYEHYQDNGKRSHNLSDDRHYQEVQGVLEVTSVEARARFMLQGKMEANETLTFTYNNNGKLAQLPWEQKL